jgi:nitroreductase
MTGGRAPEVSYPDFGEPLPIEPDHALLERLARRRSTSAQTLGPPGPSREEIALLIRLAARVPDHGKLTPWRFLVIEAAAKPALIRRLQAVAEARDDAEKAAAKLAKLANPPVSIMVVSAVRPEAAIPEWEQQLSAGAVCMSLLIAAGAMGWGANWITDWYAYDPAALAVFGLAPGERVAGIVHLGVSPEPPLERARPDPGALTSYWAG